MSRNRANLYLEGGLHFAEIVSAWQAEYQPD